MSAWLRGLLGLAALLTLSGSTCTSNFTEADLAAEERKEAEAAKREEKHDAQLGEDGGVGKEEIREQIEQTEGGVGPDF
jgi:hypothetical protein